MAQDGEFNIGINVDERELQDIEEDLETGVDVDQEVSTDGDSDTPAMDGDALSGLEDGLGEMIAPLKNLLTSVKGLIAIGAVIAGILLMLEPIQQFLSLITRQLGLFVAPALAALLMLMRPVIQWIMRNMPSFIETVQEHVRKFVDWLSQVYEQVEPIVETIINYVTMLVNAYIEWMQFMIGVYQQIGEMITRKIVNAVQDVISIIETVVRTLNNVADWIINGISSAIENIADTIVNGLSTLLSPLTDIISGLVSTMQTFADTLISGLNKIPRVNISTPDFGGSGSGTGSGNGGGGDNGTPPNGGNHQLVREVSRMRNVNDNSDEAFKETLADESNKTEDELSYGGENRR